MHDKNVQLLEEMKKMKKEKEMMKSRLNEMMAGGGGGPGGGTKSSAVDLFDENAEEVSRLDEREKKLNQWVASLQEQQARADEDATEMMREYDQLDEYKKSVRVREQAVKSREERAEREYDNVVAQVRGNGNGNAGAGTAGGSSKSKADEVGSYHQQQARLSSTNVATPVRASRQQQQQQNDGHLANSMSVRKSLREDDAEVVKLRVLRAQGREQVSRFREYCSQDQVHDLNILMQRLIQEEREEEKILRSSSIVDRAMSNAFWWSRGGSG